MKKRIGRPPHQATTTTTLPLNIDPQLKNLIIELADGYDMTITEYLTLLIQRDATQT